MISELSPQSAHIFLDDLPTVLATIRDSNAVINTNKCIYSIGQLNDILSIKEFALSLSDEVYPVLINRIIASSTSPNTINNDIIGLSLWGVYNLSKHSMIPNKFINDLIDAVIRYLTIYRSTDMHIVDLQVSSLAVITRLAQHDLIPKTKLPLVYSIVVDKLSHENSTLDKGIEVWSCLCITFLAKIYSVKNAVVLKCVRVLEGLVEDLGWKYRVLEGVCNLIDNAVINGSQQNESGKKVLYDDMAIDEILRGIIARIHTEGDGYYYENTSAVKRTEIASMKYKAMVQLSEKSRSSSKPSSPTSKATRNLINPMIQPTSPRSQASLSPTKPSTVSNLFNTPDATPTLTLPLSQPPQVPVDSPSKSSPKNSSLSIVPPSDTKSVPSPTVSPRSQVKSLSLPWVSSTKPTSPPAISSPKSAFNIILKPTSPSPTTTSKYSEAGSTDGKGDNTPVRKGSIGSIVYNDSEEQGRKYSIESLRPVARGSAITQQQPYLRSPASLPINSSSYYSTTNTPTKVGQSSQQGRRAARLVDELLEEFAVLKNEILVEIMGESSSSQGGDTDRESGSSSPHENVTHIPSYHSTPNQGHHFDDSKAKHDALYHRVEKVEDMLKNLATTIH